MIHPSSSPQVLDLNDIRVKNPLSFASHLFNLRTTSRELHIYKTAYHLLYICEGEEWKTEFNKPSGHYEYLAMPFGLANAHAVFQALVNDMLCNMLNQFVLSILMTF